METTRQSYIPLPVEIGNDTTKESESVPATSLSQEWLKAHEQEQSEPASLTREKLSKVPTQPLSSTSPTPLGAKNEGLQKQGTTFGQQLQHERELRGWTRKQLASKLHLSNAAIRRWEKNRGIPDPVFRQKLTKLFGKDFEMEYRSEQSQTGWKTLWGPQVSPPQEEAQVDTKVDSQQAPYASEQQRQTFVQQKAEGGLTAFFSSLGDGVAKLISGSVKTVVSTLLGAALFPILGPVGAGAFALGTIALTTSLQDESATPALRLQQDTIDKLVKPFPDKQFDERQLRKVIEEVLSQDKQANRDLAQFFIDLVPSIQKTAAATHIHISGPVQGLTTGDHNNITENFNGFLPRKN